MEDSSGQFKRLEDFDLFDAEIVKLILRGESIVDWHRLNLKSVEQAHELLETMEYRPTEPPDRARLEKIKNEAISYLRRQFNFPIPKPVERATTEELMMIASGEGHRQLCACAILKAMHIVHHVECRELGFTLPMSMQDVFGMVEEKVYRVIGDMLASGYPIVEFIGGRKNRDSLYTKLLSKSNTTAANVYDRIRFRIVMRSAEDILPTVLYLSKRVFPFNQVVPGQSLNTIFPFRSSFAQLPKLQGLLPMFQVDLNDELTLTDNVFSARAFRAVHFVVDVPVRLPRELLENAPNEVWALGPVVSVLSEFQIVDRETEVTNELGEGSHAAYKERQRAAVMKKLRLGSVEAGKKPEGFVRPKNK